MAPFKKDIGELSTAGDGHDKIRKMHRKIHNTETRKNDSIQPKTKYKNFGGRGDSVSESVTMDQCSDEVAEIFHSKLQLSFTSSDL